MARPTKYTEDTPQKVLEWLKDRKDQWERVAFDGTRNDRILNVDLPTVSSLANHLGISKETVYDWGRKYPKFSDSLRKVVQEQESRLLNMGLAGQYNPTIAKLILSSNHGYAEKTETKTELDVTGINITVGTQAVADAIEPDKLLSDE